ncbi:MAG: hypothetical protein P1U41_04760 [Vicingaceae bacterium]|nr:hypothetical protein [Vicingaceae bacterium]
MKKQFTLLVLIFISSIAFSQEKQSLVDKLKASTKKGDYIILEVRLNSEDEFRTIEGGSSSLARMAVFTGNNQGDEIITKGFEGMNTVVLTLNKLKKNGWRFLDTYSIKGQSLIITHYILERKK